MMTLNNYIYRSWIKIRYKDKNYCLCFRSGVFWEAAKEEKKQSTHHCLQDTKTFRSPCGLERILKLQAFQPEQQLLSNWLGLPLHYLSYFFLFFCFQWIPTYSKPSGYIVLCQGVEGTWSYVTFPPCNRVLSPMSSEESVFFSEDKSDAAASIGSFPIQLGSLEGEKLSVTGKFTAK